MGVDILCVRYLIKVDRLREWRLGPLREGLKGEGRTEWRGGGQLKATMKGREEFAGGMHKNTILASVLSL